jgi:predicted dinucleotide-binding enzyme
MPGSSGKNQRGRHLGSKEKGGEMVSGPANSTSVGIIGAGRIGQAMARIALRAGRSVVIANSRGPESLTSLVSALGDGVSAGTVPQAAAAGIVVVAVPWPRVQQALEGLQWGGQIVIDANNDFEPSDLNGRTSSEVVADLVRGARVVKAANTLGAAVLASDPQEGGGQRVIFLSGDDIDAKAEVISLFGDAGFFTIDLGALTTGGAMQQVGAPLAGVNLIRLSG